MPASAYFGNPQLKDKYVRRARRHREADQLVQGYGYWRKDDAGVVKGCAIGCLAHAEVDSHKVLERATGIPEILSHLADVIFEGLPDPAYKTWPERFASAPSPGADLSRVHHHFFHWLLTDVATFDREANPVVAAACENVAALHHRAAMRDAPSDAEWSAARSAASSSAARSAAWSAATSAWSAAESAASSAWSSAWSARSAAWSAAESAAESARSAVESADSAAYVRMADKLEALLKAAPPAKDEVGTHSIES